MKQLSLTVGIPTCYGGQSLVDTVQSIRNSAGLNGFRVFVEADRTPLSETVRENLSRLEAEVHWNETEGSQMKKVKQILAKVSEDIFVHTQDDITFPQDTLEKILSAFQQNPEVTMVAVRILPLPPENFFERIMDSMLYLVDRMARLWNGGDNRLMASGRCLAYRTEHLKKFNIPDEVVNSDIFMYMTNSALGGKFCALKDAAVYIRPPQRLKDQVGPSSRYQFQKEELKKYFGEDALKDYPLPLSVAVRAYFAELFRRPLESVLYPFVFAYTRAKRQPQKKVENPVWEVDESTKKTS